jgi:hypothetical protein
MKPEPDQTQPGRAISRATFNFVEGTFYPRKWRPVKGKTANHCDWLALPRTGASLERQEMGFPPNPMNGVGIQPNTP